MYRVATRAWKPCASGGMLGRIPIIRCLLTAVIVTMLAIATQPSVALAQGSDDAEAVSPRSWQAGAANVERNRSRGRRAVTAATDLDEYDVPRRATRSVQRSRSATRTRIVERRRATKRPVRYAALSRSDAVNVAAPRRMAKRVTKPKVRVASLGRAGLPSLAAPRPSLSGGGIAWRANSGCLASNLRSIVSSVAANYGAVTVNSTCRSARHNRRVGGARKSWHLTGNAVDFRVATSAVGRLFAHLRGMVGGIKHYGGGRFHIDNGPKRTF